MYKINYYRDPSLPLSVDQSEHAKLDFTKQSYELMMKHRNDLNYTESRNGYKSGDLGRGSNGNRSAFYAKGGARGRGGWFDQQPFKSVNKLRKSSFN